MPRSGSTFAFNVVREVLQSRGSTHHEAGNDLLGAVDRSRGTNHVLLKAHRLDPPSIELVEAGAVRVIMTVRRVEDAMASWFDTFDGLPEAAVILLMRNWLLMFRQLHGRALIVSYEQIDRRPWIAAWRIARAVCPTIGPVEVIRIARKFSKAEVKRRADQLARDAIDVTDIGFSYFDSATLFHRRHVASMVSRPAKKRLTPEQLTRIQEALAEDIKVAGLL